ncbi:MAG: tetratricopeptide repeat protein [Gammaproteobacteria bacterium]|nr:tetratricopeptide repeat protein [Gammaproteobacteria bacterium]
MTKFYSVLIFMMVFLNACTSIDYSKRETKQPSVPIALPQDATVNKQPKVITTATVTQAEPVQPKKKTPPASRTAVLELLAQSESAMQESQYEEAENLLARALRIEPSNAWLWHNMAVISFYQEDYPQAIQQALKSNNLEKNNRELKKNTDKIIKQSYIEMGNFSKAEQY